MSESVAEGATHCSGGGMRGPREAITRPVVHKRTYYLDTSTLSYAYKGKSPELALLKPWVESVALSGTLCVSYAHIAECGDWSTDWEGVAAWLDTMPFVWSVSQHFEVETEIVLKRALGLLVEAGPPFVRPAQSARDMMVVSRSVGWPTLKALPTIQTDATRDHMERATREGAALKELEANRATGLIMGLRAFALEAHERMVARRDSDYLSLLQIHRAADAPARFVELYQRDPTALRWFRIVQASGEHIYEKALVRDQESKTERRQLKGFTGDVLHAWYGGAWCDVFTCDGPTSEWVAPLRKQFGLAPPIVFRGDAIRFLSDLSATGDASWAR